VVRESKILVITEIFDFRTTPRHSAYFSVEGCGIWGRREHDWEWFRGIVSDLAADRLLEMLDRHDEAVARLSK
jgi:hypothetical protein